MTQDTPKVMTIPEVATALGCSKTHVYALIAAGRLRAVDIALIPGRKTKTRVRPDDLTAYIDSQTQEAVSA